MHVRAYLLGDRVQELEAQGLYLHPYLYVSEESHVLLGVAGAAPPDLDGILQVVVDCRRLGHLVQVDGAEAVGEGVRRTPSEDAVLIREQVISAVEHDDLATEERVSLLAREVVVEPVGELRQASQVEVVGILLLREKLSALADKSLIRCLRLGLDHLA